MSAQPDCVKCGSNACNSKVFRQSYIAVQLVDLATIDSGADTYVGQCLTLAVTLFMAIADRATDSRDTLTRMGIQWWGSTPKLWRSILRYSERIRAYGRNLAGN